MSYLCTYTNKTARGSVSWFQYYNVYFLIVMERKIWLYSKKVAERIVSMEQPSEIDPNRVQPLDEETKQHHKHRDKRLTKGCTNLMYACQQGHTQDIVKELRTKVINIWLYTHGSLVFLFSHKVSHTARKLILCYL